MKKTKIVVLGAGESGIGSAILAQKNGCDVFVSDKGKISKKYKDALLHFDIDFEEDKHSLARVLAADEIIKSPGIPDHLELIKTIQKKGISIISEIEYASRYTNAFKICVSGSNGKTTTTLWIYHILKTAGLNVGLAGNVGRSFAHQVAEENFDYYVLELSSFQLDGMFDFRAEIAILLNITPDHLDRYEYDFKKYVDSKFRIIQNQTAADAFIYCQDDEVITRKLKTIGLKSKQYPFSINTKICDEGAFLEKNKIKVNINLSKLTMTLEELALQGRHNVYNSMAASITAKLVDIRKDSIKQCLTDFQNVEHRLEFVATIHGIDFVNDSKATNVNSVWYALESMDSEVVWIAGGVDKGNLYEDLTDLVKEKVKAIICLGTDNSKLHKAFDGIIEFVIDVDNMTDAIEVSNRFAKHGDTVLLSPACASFDLFENYEDRGNQFKENVNRL